MLSAAEGGDVIFADGDRHFVFLGEGGYYLEGIEYSDATGNTRSDWEKEMWGPDSYYDRTLAQMANGEGVVWGGWYEIDNDSIINVHLRPSTTTIYGYFTDNVTAEAIFHGVVGGAIGAIACLPVTVGAGSVVCGAVSSGIAGFTSSAIPEKYNLKENEVLVVSVGHVFILSAGPVGVIGDDYSPTLVFTSYQIRIMGSYSIFYPMQILEKLI